MIETKSYALSSHAWFFREGDALNIAGTGPGGAVATPANAGIEVLPAADDEGWIFAGDVESWEDSMAQDEEKEIRKPNPGALVRKDIITVFQAMDLKLTTNSLARIAFEAFYRSATKLSEVSGQFVPLSQTPRNYWLMLQRYTHENEIVFAANLWVRMKVTGGMKGGNGEIIMPEYTCRLLDSPMNTMFFGDDSLLA